MVSRNTKTTLDTYAQDYANDPEFVAEGLAIKVTEEMLACLGQKKLSQSWLAEQMGVSRAHVSRILNARPNITLLTIAKIAVALGVKPDVCLDTWRMPWITPVSAVTSEAIVPKPSKVFAAANLDFEHSPPHELVTA